MQGGSIVLGLGHMPDGLGFIVRNRKILMEWCIVMASQKQSHDIVTVLVFTIFRHLCGVGVTVFQANLWRHSNEREYSSILLTLSKIMNLVLASLYLLLLPGGNEA